MSLRYPGAAIEIGRPAAMRSIARARRRISPPMPLSLVEWPGILNSIEWNQRLINCNGTADPFFQGALEILQDDGEVRFVGIVFSNARYLREMNIHMPSVHTLCIDGTYQVRPSYPADIAQLVTVQIVFNNVVCILRLISIFHFN